MKFKRILLAVSVIFSFIALTKLRDTFGSNANDQSLLGIDTNRDGIRDDIELYVRSRFPNSEKRRAALLQLARAWQNAFAVSNNADQLKTETNKIINATYCSLGVFGAEGGDETRALVAEMMNTRIRSETYIHIEILMQSSDIPLLPGSDFTKRCLFELSDMKN